LVYRGHYRTPLSGTDSPSVEPALYRAGPDRIERLLASGDVVDGLVVRRAEPQFAVNAAGDVVAVVSSENAGAAIVLQRGGGFERIVGPLGVTTADARRLTDVVRVALTDTATVAVLGNVHGVALEGFLYTGEGNAILLWRGAGELRVLVDADDMAGDGLPYGKLADVLARGDVIAVTAAGDLLILDGTRSLFVSPGHEPVEVGNLDAYIQALAVNDAGMVAAFSYGGPSPGTRGAVLVSGAQTGAASCPAPPPLATPTSTVMPTAQATPTASPPPARPCAGDCDGDGVVTISELISMVPCLLRPCLFIAEPTDACGGAVHVSVLIAAVNNALDGCRPGS
jgi:hypothetical protein